ncbi:hypothetical protein [Sphingomonas aracearum]|uniref:Lipoprotein n=1 Tax=Sphingomonas aracearum TaxID=2283317 RepID=A0A369VZ58_9SPHN|nr:hypothetical protein [Sphingomonas aracearum]RDE07089.1 hypothetical protein DVW87_05385 [Sphingomonas aracearum]
MRILLAALALSAPLLSGCAATAADVARDRQRAASAEERLSRELAGLTRGEARSCLPYTRTNQTRGYGDAIVYVVSPRLKYVTRAPGCEALAGGDTLVTVQTAGQLCRGDSARTIHAVSRLPTGVCSLGDFTEYRK